MVLHGTLHGGTEVEGLSALASPDDSLLGWLERDLVRVGHASATRVRHATTIAFASPHVVPLPEVLSEECYADWPVELQWLWLLASTTTPASYPPHPDDKDDLWRSSFPLSLDWRALVLRDGVAFLGLRPDHGEADPFFRFAELYVRSLYVDTLLLGVAQRLLLREILSEVADLGDPLERAMDLRVIERRLTRFRNLYWWQTVTVHGHANRLLELYAQQNRLETAARHAIEETTRFSEQIETSAAQRSNAILGLLTLFGLPIGVSVAVVQTLQWEPAWVWLLVGLAASLLVGGCLAATRWGRELFQPLRQNRADQKHPLRLPDTRSDN
jgi:hypothetical protein